MSAYQPRGYWPKSDWSLHDRLYSEKDLALPPGRWVRKGLVSVYVTDAKALAEYRRKLKGKPKPRKKLQHAPCGTTSAYRRHLREKTPACDACKRANREERARDRAKKRAAEYAKSTPFERLAIECVRYGKTESEAA